MYDIDRQRCYNYHMYEYEKSALNQITEKLRHQFPDRITAVYAFGSRVRGDHGEWSDFDVLVVVKNRDPHIENEIMTIFVEEELQSGIMFAPVIKDMKSFEGEKTLNTPFYENITREGVAF
jgi:predicted nucleotidyltransferase